MSAIIQHDIYPVHGYYHMRYDFSDPGENPGHCNKSSRYSSKYSPLDGGILTASRKCNARTRERLAFAFAFAIANALAKREPLRIH